MAYRLRRQESIPRGLRRLAAKELASARDQLQKTNPSDGRAIRDARKSVKKVRAILKLIRADGGRGLGESRKRLRDVNRKLSRVRDADAMLEILEKLKRMSPRVFDEHTVARLRRRLDAHKHESRRAAQSDQAWKKVDRELGWLKLAAKRWRPAHQRFGAIAAGIRITYRRGRKALRRAERLRRAADFHEWRKEMKALRYQLRLVEESSPALRKDIRALHRAESWLGDDHNLVVLVAALAKGPARNELEPILRAVNLYQRRLRDKTIASAKTVYAAAPRKFVRGIKREWNAWRKRDRRLGPRKPKRAAAA